MLPGFLSTCFVLAYYAGLFIRPHVTPLVFPTPLALNAASIHLLPSAVRLLAIVHSPYLALTSTPLAVKLSSLPAISSWALQGPPPPSTSPSFTWSVSASPKQNISAHQGPAIPHSPLPIFPFPLSAPPRLELPPLRHQSPPPSLPMCAPNDAPVNSSVHIPLLCPSPYFTITVNAPRNINSSALRSSTLSSQSPPTLVARFRGLRTLPFKPAQGGFGRAGTRPFESIMMAFAALAVAGVVTIALESSSSSEGDGTSDEPKVDKTSCEDNDKTTGAGATRTSNDGSDDDREDAPPPSPNSAFDDDPPELPLPDHDTHALLLALLTIAYQRPKSVELVARAECDQNEMTSRHETVDAPSTRIEQHEEQAKAGSEVGIAQEETGALPTKLSPSPDAILAKTVLLGSITCIPSSPLGLSRDAALEPSTTIAASASMSKAPLDVVTPCITPSSHDLAFLVPLPDDYEDKEQVYNTENASRFVIKREKGGRATFVDLPSTPADDSCEHPPRSSPTAEVNRAETSSSTSTSTFTPPPTNPELVASASKPVHKGQGGIETNTVPAPKKKAALAPLGVKLDGLGYWVPRLGTTAQAMSQVFARPAQELVSAIKQERPEGAAKKSVRWADTPQSASGATILKRERSVGAKPVRASSAKDAAFVASADRLMEALKAERAKLAAEVEKDKAMKETHGRAFERAMSAIREAQAANSVESGRSVQSSASSHRAPPLPIPALIQRPMAILRRPSPLALPCDDNKAPAAGPSTTSSDDEAKLNKSIASTIPPTPPTSTDDENDDAAAAGPSNAAGGENANLSKQQMLNRRRRHRKYVLMTVELFAQLSDDDIYLHDTPTKAETKAAMPNAEVVEKKEDSQEATVLVRNSRRRNSITSGTRIGPSTCPAGELEPGDPEEVDVTMEERRRCPTA